jgi:hypothetical protein
MLYSGAENFSRTEIQVDEISLREYESKGKAAALREIRDQILKPGIGTKAHMSSRTINFLFEMMKRFTLSGEQCNTISLLREAASICRLVTASMGMNSKPTLLLRRSQQHFLCLIDVEASYTILNLDINSFILTC